MICLARLLDEHGAEIYADLLRYYHVDLLDLFQGRLSPRLCLALVRLLPPGSATVAAVRGGEAHYGWDLHAYQLADIFDAIATLTFAFLRANTDKPKAVQEPDPYPRPEGNPRVRREKSPLLAVLRGEQPPPTPSGSGRVVPIRRN